MTARDPNARLIAIDERLQEKRKYHRSVRLRKLAVLIGILVVVACVVWVVFFSSVFCFSSQRAAINGAGGTSIVSEADVKSALRAFDGSPLLLTRMSSVEEHIEQIPEVDVAHAHLRFPRTIVVEVTPKVPLVCLGENRRCAPLAADATVLRVPNEQLQGLPLLTIDDSSMETQTAMRVVSGVIHTLDPAIRAQVSQYAVTKSGQVTMLLTNGGRVTWGTSDQSELKNKVLAVLLIEPHSEYDVSVPSAPVTR